MPWYETRTRLAHTLRTRARGSRALRPLIVASTGRSGTTLMMKILGTSDLIAFDDVYAYEHAYASYLLMWARLPLEGTHNGGDWYRASIDQTKHLEKHGVMGGLPWTQRLGIEADDGGEGWLEEVFPAIWEVFSQRVTRYHVAREENVRRPVYYAETAPLWTLDAMQRVRPTRGIHLIRDPRDQWVSIMAFVEAKGELSFGVRATDTPRDFAQRFVKRQKKYLERARSGALAREEGRLRVRYEDLILDTDSELTRLSTWLGVEITWPRDDPGEHTTSGSPLRSVGRWREEMPVEIANLFESELGSLLNELGYT